MRYELIGLEDGIDNVDVCKYIGDCKPPHSLDRLCKTIRHVGCEKFQEIEEYKRHYEFELEVK